jgi:anti-sigma B factor antagonist
MAERVMSGQLVIERRDHPDRWVLALYGELDLASCPLVADELEAAESAGARHVVIDLGGLEFMDSSGVHALMEANQRSLANGHRLSLLRGPRTVHRIFELTDTTSAFWFDD